MMGSEQDLTGLLRMRLLEHLLHTWDIEVALDPTATVPGDAAALVLDQLPLIVGHTAKPTGPLQLKVHTVDPELTLHFTLDPDGSHLTSSPVDQPDTAPPAHTLRLPTEAFVRLVYGRLDTHHTPATVEAVPGLLDTLRAALPGA